LLSFVDGEVKGLWKLAIFCGCHISMPPMQGRTNMIWLGGRKFLPPGGGKFFHLLVRLDALFELSQCSFFCKYTYIGRIIGKKRKKILKKIWSGKKLGGLQPPHIIRPCYVTRRDERKGWKMRGYVFFPNGSNFSNF
jgi:hypothetical protein